MIRMFFVLFFLFFASVSFAQETAYNFEPDKPPMVSFKIDKPSEIKVKMGSSNEIPKPQGDIKKENKVKTFLDKIFNRKQKPKFDTVARGYSGTLPDVKSEFAYKNPKNSKVENKGVNPERYLPEEFQQSKIDDPLFLDVILNKERPSQYLLDMLKVMKFLESFRAIIANHENIQKFNANVNILDLHARRIERLYSDKPEGMSPSYWMLLDLAYKAKVLGNLKFDANYYSKFTPVAGTQYDPLNLLSEDEKLLSDLDKTVFAIRQLND